jgi:hypothetical protein
MHNQLLQTLHGFRPVSLKEIDCVKLMTRTDKKYLCPISQLSTLLEKAQSEYRVLEIMGNRLAGYETLYLDTHPHQMYLDHHNGKRNRYKIRIRKYLTSNESFLEVKSKDTLRNTVKKRMAVSSVREILNPEWINFITLNSPFDPKSLEPKLVSSFSRITLVHPEIFERVTIDIHLAWQSGRQVIQLPNVAIIEVKSSKPNHALGFGYLLREERVHPKRVSKYCVGTAMLYPEIKHNRFKAKLLHLNKIENNSVKHESFPEFV